MKWSEPEEFEATPGKGLLCKVEGKKVIIGNRKWMETNLLRVTEDINKKIEGLEEKGQTVMLTAVDDEIVGAIAVADTVKPEAVSVVRKLNEMHIQVWMVTGDNKRTGRCFQ